MCFAVLLRNSLSALKRFAGMAAEMVSLILSCNNASEAGGRVGFRSPAETRAGVLCYELSVSPSFLTCFSMALSRALYDAGLVM